MIILYYRQDLDYLMMPVPVTPMLGEVPWPTVLIAGGLGLGALLALLSMGAARLGGSRRAGRVAHRLREAVARTIERKLVGPLRTELTDYQYFRESLATVLQSKRRLE